MQITIIAAFAACWLAGQVPAFTASPRDGGSVALPAGYTIGIDDRLSISFWRDKDLSADVVVRPDGRISLPLLNDIRVEGLTPDQLRQQLVALAEKYIDDPAATVVVREIHSRQVFITGNVVKPGSYPLNTPMTVMQLIASAGGLKEFVAGKNIVILRRDGGRDVRLGFDYQEVRKGHKLQQNVEMRPGDTVIVP